MSDFPEQDTSAYDRQELRKGLWTAFWFYSLFLGLLSLMYFRGHEILWWCVRLIKYLGG